jgi:hypothetical protein
MTRVPTGWSGKILMWLLVCLVAIATSDDFWSASVGNPGSESLIVADDDDTDGCAERMPGCASRTADCTNLRWFVRRATEVTRPADLGNGFRLRYSPRGPPTGGSDERGRKDQLAFRPPPYSSIGVRFPIAARPHHTSLEVQTLTSHARTSGVNSNQRWNALVQA